MTANMYSGQVLYHYTSFSGLMGILQSGRIWTTLMEDLADETELLYGRELVARRFELEAGRSHETVQRSRLKLCARCTRALPSISEAIRLSGLDPKVNDAKFKWYVTCFSQHRDSLPLWRGFTDRCTGYALGLRYKPHTVVSSFVHGAPARVLYSKVRQRGAVRNIVSRACELLDDRDDPFAWTIPLGQMLSLKDGLFSSEGEWRVIREGPTDDGPEMERNIQGLPRPIRYVELKLSDWELAEIVCGPLAERVAASVKIRDAVEQFGCNPASVPVVQSACRLWR